MKRERNEQMFAAWHVAAFGRAKKLPRLKEVLSDKPVTARRRQAAEQQIATLKAVFARKRGGYRTSGSASQQAKGGGGSSEPFL